MERSIWVLLTTAVLAAAPAAIDAKPRATCKAVCKRLADCKMFSDTKTCLDACKEYEASEEGRAQLLTLTRYSCKQMQSAATDPGGQQHKRSATGTGSSRNSSRRGAPTSNPDDDYLDELDKLERELKDLEKQAANELDKRSRGTRGPVRRAGAPAHGAGPAGGAGGASRGRRPAQSGSSSWTCHAEGSSVYGYDVATGGGDVRGESTVAVAGSGSSKDEAAYEAVSACGSLMTTNLARDEAMVMEASAEGDWGVRVQARCHVTQCTPM